MSTSQKRRRKQRAWCTLTDAEKRRLLAACKRERLREASLVRGVLLRWLDEQEITDPGPAQPAADPQLRIEQMSLAA